MVWYRQQLTVWPGKSILCKKTPHFRLFWWTRIWVTWLWKDLDAKRLTPGQLLGCPWKLWGITLQTSYVEGRWHQNWAGRKISRWTHKQKRGIVAIKREFWTQSLKLHERKHPWRIGWCWICEWIHVELHVCDKSGLQRKQHSLANDEEVALNICGVF